MTITGGVDIGSTYTKVVVLKDDIVAGYGIQPTGASSEGAAQAAMKDALAMSGLSLDDIQYIVSTGYGRRVTSLSNETISEISANGRGSKWIGEKQDIRTIIDIGGQDTKVIALDDNLDILDFRMNDKCAAGTGRFLEVLANELKVPLDDMGGLSLNAENPVEITTTCLVFAKSEVASLIAKGAKKEDIIAGIHIAIARRLIVMAKKVGIREVVFFDGGPARNIGMRKAFEDELGMKIYVTEHPQIVTATGAALIAKETFESKGAGSA
ncbi:MAG: 2-hydroxyglutaryl-CoA dehydratase [Thermoplasmata archaeon]|nr:MAG: 2-hydroxyglutaryl-CoA dehydratase [Thermoplasmata archaeon]